MDSDWGGVLLAAAFAAIAYGVTRAAVLAVRRRRAQRFPPDAGAPVSRQVRRARERKSRR